MLCRPPHSRRSRLRVQAASRFPPLSLNGLTRTTPCPRARKPVFPFLEPPPRRGAGRWPIPASSHAPGKGHDFHYHADQEELIYVISGTLEHWIDREKRIIGPGDSVFMPAGVVHATLPLCGGR